MKKTRLLQSLVVISIILSFFGCVYAIDAVNFAFDENNVSNVNDVTSTGTVVIKAIADLNVDYTGAISFTAKTTGVYRISVEGLTRYPGQDLYYSIKKTDGKFVRLAAYYDDLSDKYITFSNRNDDSQTDIDVLLVAGQKYVISLSTIAAAPGINGLLTYANTFSNGGEYKITITPNRSQYNTIGKIYQSDVSSAEISLAEADGLTRSYLEEAVDPYKMPDGVTAEYNKYDLWDFLVGTVEDNAEATNEYVINPLEEIICELLLILGDHLINLMNTAIGEDITITKLVYNQVESLNPNFFDKELAGAGLTANIKDVVSDWYNVFRMIAVAIYIVILLAIGIHILLASTGNGLSKAKELFTQWLKGIAALVFIPYLIKYAFLLNETLVDMLREASDIPDYSIGGNFTSGGEWSAVELEFRSPDYMSVYTGSIVFGSEEANNMYIGKIDTYEQNLDLMRLMRAYAGATKKIIYVIIFFILVGQVLSFIVLYFKRYLMIAFLIAMFPVVCIFHGISIAQGSAKGEMGTWVKEILTNIFVQFVHASVYTIVTGMCIAVVKEDMNSSAALNWIVIILAINFVSEGEKLLRKIIGAMGSSVSDSGQTSKGIKGMYGKAKANFNKLINGKEDKEG